MNAFSRSKKHISMNRVKKMHEEKYQRQLLSEKREKKRQNKIQEIVQSEAMDWRSELSKTKFDKDVVREEVVVEEKIKPRSWREELHNDVKVHHIQEGMTSQGLFFSQLPATGDQVNYQIDVNSSANFDPTFSGITYIIPEPGQDFVPYDYSIASGSFNGAVNGESGFTFRVPFDVPSEGDGAHTFSGGEYFQTTNTFTVNDDTITFNAIAGNSTEGNGKGLGRNGGTQPWKDLHVDYYVFDDDGNFVDFGSLGVVPRNTYTLTKFSFRIPDELYGKNIQIGFYNDPNSGSGGNNAYSWWVGQDLTIHPIPVDSRIGLNLHMLLNYDNINPNTFWSQYSKQDLAYFVWMDLQEEFTKQDRWGYVEENNSAGWPAPVSGSRYNLGYEEDGVNIGMTTADLEYIINYVESNFSKYRGMTTTTYGITNLQFQRQLPKNVFVGLDSPEATSFIRTDPRMMGLSAKERRKKLEELLEAGDKYMLQALGMQGSQAKIADTGDVTPWEQAAADFPTGDPSKSPPPLINPKTGWPSAPGSDRPYEGPPGTPGGSYPMAQNDDDTKVARINDQPGDSPGTIKWPKNYFPDKKAPPGPGYIPPVKKAGGGKTMVAHYEPGGKVLSEKKLKSVKDATKKIPGYYDGKPSPTGFPMEPPPKLVKLQHPELTSGDRAAGRYNKLDPASAKAMPKTAYPQIDKKVKAAQKTKSDWREELNSDRKSLYVNEGMTTQNYMTAELPATGDLVNYEIAVNDVSQFDPEFSGATDTADGKFETVPYDYNIAPGVFNGGISNGFTFAPPFNSPGDQRTSYRRGYTSYSQTTNPFKVTDDTLTLRAIAGNSLGNGLGSNGGTRPSYDLDVFYLEVDDNGEFVSSGTLGVIPKSTDSLTEFKFKIPDELFDKNIQVYMYSNDSSDATQWWLGTPVSFHPEAVSYDTKNWFHGILNKDILPAESGFPETDDTSMAYIIWSRMQEAYAGSAWGDTGSGVQGYPAPVSGGTRPFETDEDGNPTPQSFTMADANYIVNYIRNAFRQYKGMSTTKWGITNLQFKRQTPKSVFVSLDSPEASSFIRSDPFGSNLSAKERRKRLEQLLKAGDKYMQQVLGMDSGNAQIADTGDVTPWKSSPDPYGNWDNASPNPYDSSGKGDYGDVALDTIPYEPPSPGPGGYKPPGSYDPNKFYDLKNDPSQLPSPNLPSTGPGRSSVPTDDTQVASARGPYGTPGADKPYTRKGYKDKDGKFVDFDNPATWPKIPKASKGGNTMVAHYEPEGEVIAEKKKLKSVKDIAKKIPGYYDGKPSPTGFPMEPPPKMIKGFHPDIVTGDRAAKRFNKLDPASAKAMPKTAYPHIDKKVQAARKKPQ